MFGHACEIMESTHNLWYKRWCCSLQHPPSPVSHIDFKKCAQSNTRIALLTFHFFVSIKKFSACAPGTHMHQGFGLVVKALSECLLFISTLVSFGVRTCVRTIGRKTTLVLLLTIIPSTTSGITATFPLEGLASKPELLELVQLARLSI